MRERILEKNKVRVRRIGKREARRRYNNGEEILLAPHKANVELFGGWISNANCGKFDILVNEHEFFNCNAELGKYAAYYMKIE